MRNIAGKLVLMMVATALLAAGPVAATPNITDAVLTTRIFDNCPTSVLDTFELYPVSIRIEDSVLDCLGFANRHNWRLSADGVTAADFDNDSDFMLCADLRIDGTSEGEAGLQISPWWSQDVDGVFNVRTTDGEIAIFGGRLPFYSFTVDQGVTYVKGTSIRLCMTYLSNGLSMADPATVEYSLWYGPNFYSSGPLPFDEGNPGEDPPYGLWGMLNEARVGGHLQAFLQAGNPDANLSATWKNIDFQILKPISVDATTWGGVKGLYR